MEPPQCIPAALIVVRTWTKSTGCPRYTKAVDNVSSHESCSSKNRSRMPCRRSSAPASKPVGPLDCTSNRRPVEPQSDLPGYLSSSCQKTYRPPWTLIMGLPVRVIKTSCMPLLCSTEGFRHVLLEAARRPLLACVVQHFCMVMRWTTQWSR